MKEDTGWWICFWLALIYIAILTHPKGVNIILAGGTSCETVKHEVSK